MVYKKYFEGVELRCTSNSSSPAFSLPSLIAAPLFKIFLMKNVLNLLVATSLLVTVNPRPSDPVKA